MRHSPTAAARRHARSVVRAASAANAAASDNPSTSARSGEALAAVLTMQLGLSAAEAAAVAPALAAIDPSALSSRAAALRDRFKPSHVRALAAHAPAALALDVCEWMEFLEAWADGEVVWQVLRHHHATLAATDVFTAGRAILFLKRVGPWDDADIGRRVLPCHAPLLARDEAHLEGVVGRLRGLGLAEERVRDLLYLSPGLLYAGFGEEQLALAERVFERNRSKYAFTGSYEV